MKGFSVILILSLFFTGCQKNDPPANQDPLSSVSFLANGTSVVVSGSSALNQIKKIPASNSQLAGYALEALTNGKYVISTFILTNNSVTVTTYNTVHSQYPSAEYTICNFPGQLNGGYANRFGDYIAVTITNISNGYADGSFTATMRNVYNLDNKVSITNGLFKHIKIIN